MTRNELERVLADHGYVKKYHGTRSDTWQKEESMFELSNDRVFHGHIYVRYEMLSFEDDKLILHREIKL